MRVFDRDSCVIDIAVCASFFLWLYFPYVTLHFVSSLYLEYSVRWLEFICLCFGHHFRYYMIFSTKVDIELIIVDALYWVVSSSLLFHLNQFEWLWWCDYLAFDKYHVYVFVVSLCGIWLHAQWLCDCFIQIHKSVNVILNLVLLNPYWEIPLWKKIPVSS